MPEMKTWTANGITYNIRDTGAPRIADVAPSGYGLGGAVTKKWADVDSLYAPGWYKFNDPDSPAIAGGSTFSYAYMRVDAFNNTAAQQTLYPITASRVVLRRMRSGSEWDAEWEWVNPPMTPGVEYRTTKRKNGKVVYTKWVDLGALPASGAKTTIYSATQQMNPVSFQVFVITASGYVNSMPFFTTAGTLMCKAYDSGQSIIINAFNDCSELTGYAIVEYTKN